MKDNINYFGVIVLLDYLVDRIKEEKYLCDKERYLKMFLEVSKIYLGSDKDE